jgi:putative tryptophan/tyrosine transport system substrate-binding protein
LYLLKELVPDIVNVMMLYEPANINWQGFLPTLEAAAPSLHVTVRPAPAIVIADAEQHIETFGRDPGGGMIVIPTALTVGNREMITALAERYGLPATYPFKYFVSSGGLISYGSDIDDLTRRTAQYANRILKGTKPADLPVQAPTTFELAINLKTAKALGLTVPNTLLVSADAVIE